MALFPAMWSTLALIAFHFRTKSVMSLKPCGQRFFIHYRLGADSLLPDAATGRELHVLEGSGELRPHRDMVDAHSLHALMQDWVGTLPVILQDEDSMKYGQGRSCPCHALFK